MGMFDYLHCDYPLPGKPLKFVKEFQTKSLDCIMQEIRITNDGKLTDGKLSDFTGLIEFYGSNIVAAGPAGFYTRNGEDSEYVTFEATFIEGKLRNIKQVGYEIKPSLAYSEMKPISKLGSKLNEYECLINKKLFVLYGGRSVEEGYYAEVVYETEKQLCIKYNNKLELVYRLQIGNVLFNDMEEAKADMDYRKAEIEKEKQEYQRKIADK